MATLQEQIAQAKAAGYSDADIARHLSQKGDLAPKIKTAMDAGYKPEEIIAHLAGAKPAGAVAPKDEVSDSSIVAAAAGLGEGAGKVALGAQEYLGKGLRALGADKAGNWLVNDAQQGRAKLKGELAPYRQKSPFAAGAGELGGEVLSTLPVGGVLAKGLRAAAPAAIAASPRLAGLANAIETSGMRAGSTPGAVNMLTRMAGGAITGGASAGLIDPSSAGTGAVVGAALPPLLYTAGKVGGAAGNLIRPFYRSGQEHIAGNALREFASNPENALRNLKNSTEIIPGSDPTAVMAAGDEGLSGLSRTLQSQNGQYAAELAARQSAQNAARTQAMEGVAGNTGKIALAEKSRDAITAPMRESVLDSAGKLPAQPVLNSIDRLLKDPENAGKLSQQALGEFRSRIAQFSPDGSIDARALYAIRKDINDVLSGKLQGESGNMRYASGQLVKVKGLIDDAIDKASRVVPRGGRDLMPFGPNMTTFAAPYATGPRPTWSQYLQTYAEHSKPIEQMKELDDVLKRIQTGTVDKHGNAVLSAAKLNNLLKNDGRRLEEKLTGEQIDLLRRLSADLNASQLASNSGKAVGSNTMQNLSQGNFLKETMGRYIGGSTPITSTLGRLMQIPYGAANTQIQERIGNALLDPREAARLLQTPAGNKLLEALNKNSAIAYKAAPAAIAQ